MVNWKNVRLVKVGNQYAVRVGWFEKKYADLVTPGHFWKRRCTYFRHCLTDDIEEAKLVYDTLFDKVIK